MRERPRSSPGTPCISPSYSSVSAIGSTLGYCPVATSPTPIEHGGSVAKGGDMWYVIVPFGPRVPYSFNVCYSSKATVRRKGAPSPPIVRPSTPVPSPPLTQSLPIPLDHHSAVFKSRIAIPPRVGGLRRKFVDEDIRDRWIKRSPRSVRPPFHRDAHQTLTLVPHSQQKR